MEKIQGGRAVRMPYSISSICHGNIRVNKTPGSALLLLLLGWFFAV
jgi:hypothetical protein